VTVSSSPPPPCLALSLLYDLYDFMCDGKPCVNTYPGTTWLTWLVDEMKRTHCELKKNNTGISCKPCLSLPTTNKHDKDAVFRLSSQYDKNIFIFRDTRDVVVSHYHWAPHFIDNIKDFVFDNTYGVKHVIREQNSFINTVKKCKQRRISYLIIYYEDLKHNTQFEMMRLRRYLNFNLGGKSHIESILNASSFSNMRSSEQEGKLALKVHPESAQTLLEALNKQKEEGGGGQIKPEELFGVMTRKGEVGGYVDELDDETISYVEGVMREELETSLRNRYLYLNSSLSNM
jgi:hypothetical protein